MRLDTVRVVLSVALFSLFVAPTASLRAQTVTGTVTDASTGQPVEGVLVRLEAPDAGTGAHTFTDGSGRFRLRAPSPGRARLRADMIGYRMHSGESFLVEEGESVERDIQLQPEAVELGDLSARGERRCHVQPEEGEETYRLWEAARKALTAARAAEEDQLLALRVRVFRRSLDRSLQVESLDTAVVREGRGMEPFRAPSPDSVSRRGYVVERDDERIYHGVDARILLSDTFLQDHCFRTRTEDPPRSEWVGLAFEPAEGREVPEVRGTLWLDRETAELRRLEFEYVNLGLPTREHRAGGTVEFTRLPTGPWIVHRWSLRMPRIERRRVRHPGVLQPEYRVAGYGEEGGEVLRVTDLAGRVLFDPGRATVAGAVWDSLRAAPLADAPVTVAGTGWADTTDAGGRFRIAGLPEGRYRVEVRPPEWERWGLEPAARTVEAEAGGRHELRLATPGPRTLARRWCGAGDGRDGAAADDAGLLVGRVVDPEGRPVPGARVAAVWRPPTARGADAGAEGEDGAAADEADAGAAKDARTGDYRHREVWADSAGRYAVCGVPPEARVAVRAEREGLVSEAAEVELSPAGFAAGPLRLSREGQLDRMAEVLRAQGLGGGRADGAADDGTTPPALVLGTVRAADTGRPLETAEVRLGDSLRVATDSAGRFRLEGVAPGVHELTVRYLGFASRTTLLRVPPGDTLRPEIEMATEAVPLPGLRVEVEGRHPRAAKMEGFYDRRERLPFGHFLDREELEKVPGDDLHRVFRQIHGVRVSRCPGKVPAPGCYLLETTGPQSFQRGCEWVYYLDGARVPLILENAKGDVVAGLNQISKSDVEAVEVYPGPIVPARFAGSDTSCGVVMLWTRTGE